MLFLLWNLWFWRDLIFEFVVFLEEIFLREICELYGEFVFIGG